MRTTFDLPDDLFRDLKVQAAQKGMKMKDLVTFFLKDGLYGKTARVPATKGIMRNKPEVSKVKEGASSPEKPARPENQSDLLF